MECIGALCEVYRVSSFQKSSRLELNFFLVSNDFGCGVRLLGMMPFPESICVWGHSSPLLKKAPDQPALGGAFYEAGCGGVLFWWGRAGTSVFWTKGHKDCGLYSSLIQFSLAQKVPCQSAVSTEGVRGPESRCKSGCKKERERHTERERERERGGDRDRERGRQKERERKIKKDREKERERGKERGREREREAFGEVEAMDAT